MITVYTCITGQKDNLTDNQNKGNAHFLAFVEQCAATDIWEQKILRGIFTDPRRNSRLPKILAHQYVNSEYSIYIDGNISILKDPQEIVDKYLKDHDLAIYKHPVRNCLYDEAKICVEKRLDDPEIIIEQAKTYEDNEYAKNKGLCECGIIIRRHTPKVEMFNNYWFSEYSRHSRRDQISFMYAADKVGLRINKIDDFFIETSPAHAIKQSGDFEIVVHNHMK